MITLGCMVSYFGILQYLLKGQTVGKKILKLRVVTLDNKKVGFGWLILRCLIVNNILLNIINLGCLWLLKMNSYNKVVNVLEIIISVVETVIIYLVITREDGRGLHDLICKTQVIREEKGEINKNKKNSKVIDGKYTEK